MGERLLRGSRDRRETERSKERERERDIGSENINYNTNARTTHTFPACRHMFQKMLETMGVDNVIAIDLHRPEIKGFFRVPVVHVAATGIGAAFFAEKELHAPVVVSPKAGGVLRAQQVGATR